MTPPTYTLRIRERDPGDDFNYEWTLCADGEEITTSYADTKWGCRFAARGVARKHRKFQSRTRYDTRETLNT